MNLIVQALNNENGSQPRGEKDALVPIKSPEKSHECELKKICVKKKCPVTLSGTY